jgi:biotin carboxyl carrier protein
VPDADRQKERTDGSRAAEASRGPEASRKADHAGIARLADELLPALIAKLGTTQLGELEVREGDWQVRLRRPYGTAPGEGRRSGDKPSRAQPGHEGHGHGRAAPEGHRGGKAGSGSAGSTNGTGAREDAEKSRTIATSPAVGIFQPGSRAASGTRVRAGDSLGAVNVLGVPQDVLAPVDGIVGSTLVEAGTAVEYGQELIRIELTTPAAPAEAG